jgi:hypothetical protein
LDSMGVIDCRAVDWRAALRIGLVVIGGIFPCVDGYWICTKMLPLGRALPAPPKMISERLVSAVRMYNTILGY